MTVVHTFVNEEGHPTLPTMEEITNLYLYGQITKPDNMLDPSTWGVNTKVTDNKVCTCQVFA